MNKLLTKIVGAALGLSMTVGVGVAVASQNNSVQKAEAAQATVNHTLSSKNAISASDSFPFNVTYSGTYEWNSPQLRFTSTNGTITFEGNSTVVTIDSIQIGCSSASYAPAGTASTGYTTSVSSSTVTITKTGSGSSTVVWTLGAAGRAKTYKITYTVAAASYTVSYNANGGTGTMSGSTESSGSFTLPSCSFTYNSKVFIGWKANNTGDLIAAAGTYNLTGNTVFWAQWADESTANNPYTVAQARALGDTLGTTVTLANAYVGGIIYDVHTLSSNALTYWISDDGSNSNGFEIYKGKGISGADFSALTDLSVEDEVVVKGTLKKYNATTYELDAGSQLISRKTLTSIAVKTAPTKVDYDADEFFDPTDLVITATYTTTTSGGSSTTTKDIAYAGNEADFEFTPSLTTGLSSADDEVEITYKGKITTQSITVTAIPVVTSVSLDKESINIDIDGISTLTATITADEGAVYTVTWSSSDATIASISGDGLTRTITGKKRGTATITVTAGTQSDTCTVTVNDPNSIVFTRSDFGENASQIEVTAAKNNISFVISQGAIESDKVKPYKNQTVTISCDDHDITQIEFTCTVSGNTKGGPGCLSIASGYTYSGYVGTWEGKTNSVMFTATDQVYISQIVVVLSSEVLTPSLSISSASINARVGKGTLATLTPSHFGGDSVTYSNDTNACATLSYTGNTLTVTGNAVGSHTFTITATSTSDNTKTASVEVNVVVEASLGVLTKVTSESALTFGDTYVLGTADSTYKVLMGALSGSVRSAIDSENAINDGLTEVDADEMSNDVSLLTLLPASNGKYYIYDISNDKYLIGNDSKADLTNSSNLAGASEWTITISDGTLSILHSSRVIKYNYNNGNDRFGCYNSDFGVAPVLYKVSGSSLKTRLSNFCSDTMKMSSYIGDETYNETRCDENYGAAKIAYNNLTEAERLLFVTQAEYADAYARLVKWATANHEVISTDNNGNTNVLTSAQIGSVVLANSYNTAAIISVIAVLSLSAVAGYFMLRKRKEQ